MMPNDLELDEVTVVAWEMVKQGLGIGVMADAVAVLMPEVECLLPEVGPIRVPIWLATHRELHTSRRMRIVFDLLAEALTAGPANALAGLDLSDSNTAARPRTGQDFGR